MYCLQFGRGINTHLDSEWNRALHKALLSNNQAVANLMAPAYLQGYSKHTNCLNCLKYGNG